jgi:hypothetical protein
MDVGRKYKKGAKVWTLGSEGRERMSGIGRSLNGVCGKMVVSGGGETQAKAIRNCTWVDPLVRRVQGLLRKGLRR